jgi:hypothetical protein
MMTVTTRVTMRRRSRTSKKDKCGRGDAFERQVLEAVKQHPKVQDVMQIGQSGDKLGDLYVLLKKGDGKARMVQRRIKSEVSGGTGLTAVAMKKFRRVLFMLLNTKRRTFYVLMPETGEGSIEDASEKIELI